MGADARSIWKKTAVSEAMRVGELGFLTKAKHLHAPHAASSCDEIVKGVYQIVVAMPNRR